MMFNLWTPNPNVRGLTTTKARRARARKFGGRTRLTALSNDEQIARRGRYVAARVGSGASRQRHSSQASGLVADWHLRVRRRQLR